MYKNAILLIGFLLTTSFAQFTVSPIKEVKITLSHSTQTVALITKEKHNSNYDTLYSTGYNFSGSVIDGNRNFWDSLFLATEIVEDENCFEKCGSIRPEGIVQIVDAKSDTFIIEYYDCIYEGDRLKSRGERFCLSFGKMWQQYDKRMKRVLRTIKSTIANK